MHGQQNVKTSK